MELGTNKFNHPRSLNLQMQTNCTMKSLKWALQPNQPAAKPQTEPSANLHFYTITKTCSTTKQTKTYTLPSVASILINCVISKAKQPAKTLTAPYQYTQLEQYLNLITRNRSNPKTECMVQLEACGCLLLMGVWKFRDSHSSLHLSLSKHTLNVSLPTSCLLQHTLFIPELSFPASIRSSSLPFRNLQ